MTKAIVFDLWFTLITPEDFVHPYVSTTRSIPAALGLEAEPFLEYWKECLPQQHRDPRPVREYVADYLREQGREMTVEESATFDAVWRYHDMALASPRPKVLDGLQKLAESGVKLGLLSNAHEREVREWHLSPLAEHFDGAAFSCHIGSVKPEPEAYFSILDKLDVSASNATFVGDGASSELEGARAAGFERMVWMRGFYDAWGLDVQTTASYISQADAVIVHVSELATIFRANSNG